MQKIALERAKYFPVLAWGTIIGFSLFVYSLVVNLQTAVADLGQVTSQLESAVNQSDYSAAITTDLHQNI